MRTGPLAACTTFVETLPSLIRPIAPRSRLPTVSKVLSGACSSAASRSEAAASPTISRAFGRDQRRLSSSRERSRRAFSALRSSSSTMHGRTGGPLRPPPATAGRHAAPGPARRGVRKGTPRGLPLPWPSPSRRPRRSPSRAATQHQASGSGVSPPRRRSQVRYAPRAPGPGCRSLRAPPRSPLQGPVSPPPPFPP